MHGIDLDHLVEAQILAAHSSSPYGMEIPTTDTATLLRRLE
jgi:hypothetical protein